jgi:hypothetical protein
LGVSARKWALMLSSLAGTVLCRFSGRNRQRGVFGLLEGDLPDDLLRCRSMQKLSTSG